MIKDSMARWEEIQQMNLDVQVAAAVLQGICRVEAEFGPIDFSIGLSEDLRLCEGGLACCSVKDNSILLAREYFLESSYDTLETIMNQNVKNKFHPECRMKVASVVAHEMCHAVWNTIERQGVRLCDEVVEVMKGWVADMQKQRKRFYMSYAAQNVFEFWAEMLTQHMCGTPDTYTGQVMAIAHKYLPK